METKKSRTPLVHKTDVVIDRKKLKAILDSKGLEYVDLYDKVVAEFGLDLTYKGFMSVIAGKATWKLLYAYAVANVLNVEIMDIFELVKTGVKKAEKPEKRVKRRYNIN